MYQFKHISEENIHLIEYFLSVLGKGAESFRYFAKRPVNIVLNHLLTVVILDENQLPMAYGHLDREGTNLWLGIAVAEKSQGLGLGKMMLQYLIDYAKDRGELFITLTVDKINFKAINLYETCKFIQVADQGHCYKYRYQLA